MISMKHMAAAFIGAATFAAGAAELQPHGLLAKPLAQRAIPNQYIVVLDKTMAATARSQGIAALSQTLLTRVGGGRVLEHYEHALLGFSVRMTAVQAEALAAVPGVQFVEQDQRMDASANTTQTNATWGLDRIDQRARPMNGTYIYPSQAGAGVNVYVIDTGINASHTEFSGRIGNGRNFAPNNNSPLCNLFNIGCQTSPTDVTDCNGHGTHVSGTALGTVYGVAKRATLHPVRVLACNGSGSTTGVIAGVDWVTANHVAPSVANMSLGGGDSPALDTAVQNSIASGVTYAVAAGNDNANACVGSPNKVPQALTVGASDNADVRASFSNFGTCVDLFGPGVNITSASSTSTNGTAVLSGTSMATPHVAGAAALILGASPALSPAQVTDALLGNVTTGVLTNIGNGSPNALLYEAH